MSDNFVSLACKQTVCAVFSAKFICILCIIYVYSSYMCIVRKTTRNIQLGSFGNRIKQVVITARINLILNYNNVQFG